MLGVVFGWPTLTTKNNNFKLIIENPSKVCIFQNHILNTLHVNIQNGKKNYVFTYL